VDDFLSQLVNYDKENIPEVCQRAIQPYLHDKEFDPDLIRSKSLAAAGLCAWVINIMKFYEVFCEVYRSRRLTHSHPERARSVLDHYGGLSTANVNHIILSQKFSGYVDIHTNYERVTCVIPITSLGSFYRASALAVFDVSLYR